MRFKSSFLIVFFIIIYQSLFCRQTEILRNWKFINKETKNAEKINFIDADWQEVTVPHDWAIRQPFDMNIDMQHVVVKEDGDTFPKLRTGRTGALPCFGTGWYRTRIQSNMEMKNKRIRVEFDGAMSEAKVFLNGNFIGEWPYGYTYFAFDLTDNWNFEGENILSVRLENKPESSRWYPGAGLYRHVRIVIDDPIHVSRWGTSITTPEVSGKRAIVNVITKLENHTGESQKIQLLTSIINAEGETVVSSKQTKDINETGEFNTQLTVSSPQLWDTEHPELYTVVSKISSSLGELDGDVNTFGIRSIRFDAQKGFFLNGRNVKMKGVCLHHDLGPLGAAVNYRAIERQLELLKNLGCNAIRTSHNPPAPELTELCDKMGFLMQIEAFDEWRLGKNENGYSRFFDNWAKKDLRSMILQNRNHPSVVMWSIGNEIREQTKRDGVETARFLADICRRTDPTRPVTAGFNTHDAAIKNGLADVVDLVGFNYKPYDYKPKHEKYPQYVLYGSETASTVSTRGEYKFPVREIKSPFYENYQVSSYDLEYPEWASTPETEFEQQDDCPFIFGEFVWTGFDYLGEPTPYNEGTPARSSYFGIMDLAGMKKDRFYLYQSRWGREPVLHLLPHWNWDDRLGQQVPVYCYTNYPKAELFVNGVSHGIREKNVHSKYERYRLMWNDVVYQPGEIKIVAYDKEGDSVASQVIKTAGPSYSVCLTPDRCSINADGEDLSYIEVNILDKNGNICPRADNLLFVEVTGNARLKALSNGDPTDQTAFSSNYMRTFNGKLMIVIQSTHEAGSATVNVYGGNLQNAKTNIMIK